MHIRFMQHLLQLQVFLLHSRLCQEAVIALGCVPIAEYGTPSTNEIPDRLEKYLPYYDAVLLESHGALTWSQIFLLHT